MDKMLTLPKLNAELFTYENWEAGYWDMLGLGYIESINEENIIRAIKEYGIGYCDSSRLKCRPRDNKYVAVMCERDGEKFWFHVFKDDIENILQVED
ncbi:MAG: hypothetical protein LIR46_08115 [Bacteroidota bacterium]|nr:hypothetical protein [Bacteroidota bacterium]